MREPRACTSIYDGSEGRDPVSESMPDRDAPERGAPASPIWSVDDQGMLVWRDSDRFSGTWLSDALSAEDDGRISPEDGTLLVQAVGERNLYAWLLTRLVANAWSEDFVADVVRLASKALAESTIHHDPEAPK